MGHDDRDSGEGDDRDRRDFFAEGVDAFCAGHSDIPPADVSEHGLAAEADWIDGFMSAEDGEEDDVEVYDPANDPLINSL